MKKEILSLGLALLMGAFQSVRAAAPAVNLTPAPKQISVSDGTLSLPPAFSIKADGLSAEMAAEITKFSAALTASTGIQTGSGPELFAVTADESIAPEGYTLSVTADGVKIKASTPAGLFYAFQTVKKVLPANVAAGVLREGSYSLPLMEIADEPRYAWRGMELDCARHFFELDELKKMLDVMATYKMNRMHWHLTDDQGWRLEMAKYPKLTTAAASPLNNYWCDFDNRHSYVLNEPYGPYYYTIDEMKELVAYAKELHIEICPEVDMPGHMQAAIAAYPEFSTTPGGDHPVRFWPGVSEDVLDISNPAVVQFTKDIIEQLTEIFPYEYIHIGGDECPTGAWANSASCQQFKKDYGLKSDRAIQNWLTKELADYAKTLDRKLICWNEVLTTDGADKNMVKDADILIYAWLNAGAANNPSKQAADLGLRSVWCSTHHYYLDYPQWAGSGEPLAMGHVINLETVYKATPDYENTAKKRDLYYGVNCNLWTEYVCEPKHLEYNALPRMIAVAETGWTPAEKKDWNDFLARFNADTEYLDLGNYTYGRHYVDDKEMPEDGKYYRLITMATNNGRADRCIELVAEGSPLISSLGASAGQIWSAPQAAEGDANFDSQYWRIEADPAGSGLYALVCRAAEEGSLNPQMQGTTVDGRWVYSEAEKHYGFVIGDYYGDHQGQHTYSIRANNGETAYVNCGVQGNNLTINNWHQPDDGDGGLWFFNLEGFVAPAEPGLPAFTPLAEGSEFSLQNALDAANEQFICASADAQPMLTNADNAAWAARLWEVKESNYDTEANVQTFELYNPDMKLYLGVPADAAVTSATQAAGSFAAYQGNLGHPLSLTADASAAATVTMTRPAADTDEYMLSIGGKNLFPISHGSEMLPGAISAHNGATRQTGAHWKVNTAPAATYNVTFNDGTEPQTLRRQIADGENATEVSSPFSDYEVESVSPAADGSYDLALRRKHYAMTYLCVDAKGQLWGVVTDYAPTDAQYTPAAPEISGMTGGKVEGDITPFVPEAEKTFTARYDTEAYPGVASVAEKVNTLQADKYYLIRDAHVDRNAFRCDDGGNVVGAKNAAGKGANYVWTLEADGDNWFIKNVGTEAYVQAVKKSTNGTTKPDKPYAFTISPRDGGANAQWTVKNGKNAICWDGNENMSMVGWDSPGHPIEFYEFTATPFFKVTIEERDQDGKLLASKTQFVRPGASYTFAAAARPGKALSEVTGNEGLDNIQENKLITVTYSTGNPESGLNEIATDDAADPAKGIYDLSGRRLSKVSRPGIYIINGIKTAYK